MSTSRRALATVRRPDSAEEKRLPDYTVRARVGPGMKDWMRVGSAWKGETREGNEVITVVLGALPVSINNRVTLKLLIPLEPEEQAPVLPEHEGFDDRRE